MTRPLLTPAAEAIARAVCAAIGAAEKDDAISALLSVLSAAINDHPEAGSAKHALAIADAVADTLVDLVEAGQAGRLAHGTAH